MEMFEPLLERVASKCLNVGSLLRLTLKENNP